MSGGYGGSVQKLPGSIKHDIVLTAEQQISAAERVYNFSAGPCVMPLEVLVQAQNEMISFNGTGMSIMEMSHRSKAYVAVAEQATKDLRDILCIPDTHKTFFMQGGATLQFAGVPCNLLGEQGAEADYIVTGQWSEKAVKECNKYGKGNVVANTKPTKHTSIPPKSEWKLSEKAKYFHYCMNETVNGVEFKDIPDVPHLVADMSSNFMSRPIHAEKHDMIYAGIQKNLGPAGMCVGIVKADLLGKALPICPTYCDWKVCADADSMYNTPACYTWYIMGLYLKYTKEKGGIPYWDDLAEKKSKMIYDVIDGSDGFYTAPVNKDCRSRMNIPFQIQGGNEDLEKKWLKEAEKMKLFTLAGHRSVGGIRASLYNGMPLEGVACLSDFMKSFQQENSK
jgi:phosphoserine aminotransferase